MLGAPVKASAVTCARPATAVLLVLLPMALGISVVRSASTTTALTANSVLMTSAVSISVCLSGMGNSLSLLSAAVYAYEAVTGRFEAPLIAVTSLPISVTMVSLAAAVTCTGDETAPEVTVRP